MKKKWGMRRRLRYAFDNSMAAGTIALIALLALVSAASITLIAAFVTAARIAPAGEEPMGFGESFWSSLMRTLDPGTMGGDQGWSFRLAMLAVTLAGIFIVSALIGVISSGLQDRIEELRKGRSLVIENDHTIILNWSDAIFDVLAQLIIANESRTRPRIVILADQEKIDMEEQISAKVPDPKNSRIICRSGDPTDLLDLGIVNPETSRSIIILSPNAPDPDARVIKSILALVRDPNRRQSAYRIAAEIRDVDNAKVAKVVGGSEAQLILGDDFISKIVVQSTRQSGVSEVYTELLNFEGCEIYAVEQDAIVGKPFGEALLHYDACSLLGYSDPDGDVHINPPMDSIVAAGSKAILIAEDDSLVCASQPPPANRKAKRPAYSPTARAPERTLLIGWNRRVPYIIHELSRFVEPGSAIKIGATSEAIMAKAARLEAASSNLEIEVAAIDMLSRDSIEMLNPQAYDHVLVLGDGEAMDAQSADTRTIVSLLHLRAICEEAGSDLNIVSELIDVRNLPLAELTQVDDFVVSNKLVSLMLAQASENPFMEQIFTDILDEEGSEIYLRPASQYVSLGRECTFYDVVRIAASRGEVAIGHHLVSRKEEGSAGIVVNPRKSEVVSYSKDDRIIVFAQE